jgi:molybdopterin biosynthesis enzyme MoaB
MPDHSSTAALIAVSTHNALRDSATAADEVFVMASATLWLMKSQYKAVVIGGGIVGTSVLYHLARSGWTDLALIERAELTAGSTWHAAAGFHALNDDPNIAALQGYTIRLYDEIERESGQSVGMHMTGGVSLAASDERWQMLKAERAMYETMDMETRLVSPEEIREMCPLVDPTGLKGGLYDAHEGYVDAHGATLAADIYAGDRLVLREGTRIRSTQIGLAASIGRDHLPTRPHPRVVVLSAGPDLVEPGQPLKNASDEYETNSWLLTTAVREVGAVAYRVHSIPDNEEQLQKVIEDQLVRADLIIISGERHDDSFDLITRTLSGLGEITTVDMAIEASGRHNFGTIGPDKTPVVTLPGDPIASYISFELFVRPMIRTMLGAATIHRPSVKAALERPIASSGGVRSYIRAILAEDGKSVVPLENQDEQSTLSDANAFIAVSESDTDLKTGDQVTVVVLERRYI